MEIVRAASTFRQIWLQIKMDSASAEIYKYFIQIIAKLQNTINWLNWKINVYFSFICIDAKIASFL